jgi:hypothetical protein
MVKLAKLDLYLGESAVICISFRSVVVLQDDCSRLLFSYFEPNDERKHYAGFLKDHIVGVLRCPEEPLPE